MNDAALTVLMYIAYAFMIICTVASLYKLFSYGRLRIFACCAPDFDLPNAASTRTAQITLILTLLTSLCTFKQHTTLYNPPQ